MTTLNQSEIKKSNIESAEWYFVGAVIVVVLIITTLPYAVAYLTTPPDKQYMGLVLNVPDHGQYFSWLYDLTTANLAANKLTPEANPPVFFNLLWWSLGRFNGLLGLKGYAVAYQLMRFVSIPLFLLLAYRICAWFLEDKQMRRVAFAMITFSSGFGWFLIILKYILREADPPYPLLVFGAEGNTLLCMMGYPHFIAAALYVFIFDLVLRGQVQEKLSYAVAAGCVALFFGWQHTYDLFLVYGILGSYGLLTMARDRQLPMYLVKSGVIIGLISFWPGLYSVWLTSSANPIWQEVLAQFGNVGVYTPNPFYLPALLGVSFLIALFTAIKNNPFRLQGLSNNGLFLKTWFWVNFALIYIPTDFQIHMLNGWQIPIAILATQGLFYYVLPWLESRNWRPRPNFVLAAVILVVIPTNLYLITWRVLELKRHEYPYFLYKDEVSALNWLEVNAKPDDAILSSMTVGQYIPALTGSHAFLAHWAQTVDYFTKKKMVEDFFTPEIPDTRRQEILKNCNPKYQARLAREGLEKNNPSWGEQYSCRVQYIFFGPAERELGNYQLAKSPLLEHVYTAGQVEIYKVR